MLFQIKVNKNPLGFGGGRQEGERQQLKLVLGRIAEQLGDKSKMGGLIADPNGATRPPIGDWLYVPNAPPELDAADPVDPHAE